MYRIAVMGDYDSIYGFAALGFETVPVKTGEEAEEKLSELAKNGCAVVYITESLASRIEGEISKYKGKMLPAIIRIPGVSGNTGSGIDGVKKSVEQAVGSDILFSHDH